LMYDEPLDSARFVGFVLVWLGLACSLADTMRTRTPAR